MLLMLMLLKKKWSTDSDCYLSIPPTKTPLVTICLARTRSTGYLSLASGMAEVKKTTTYRTTKRAPPREPVPIRISPGRTGWRNFPDGKYLLETIVVSFWLGMLFWLGCVYGGE